MNYSYDIRNWYWNVANSSTRVWSSASVSYVPLTDATYQAWLAAGNRPSQASSEAALQQIFADGYPAGWPLTLEQQAEVAMLAGLTVSMTGSFILGATRFPTDPTTQLKLGNVANIVNSTSTFPNGQSTFPMRDSSGTWHNFTVSQYLAVTGAIANYVTVLFLIIDGNPVNLTELPSNTVTLTV